jgi:glycosyltransferase involved in cell wall biosynthesis
MRIGVFCTNEYTTPPPKGIIYAPLVVAQQIADGLTDRGHTVTIYAPKGSRVKSRLHTGGLPSLYQNRILKEFTAINVERGVASYENLALSQLFRHAQQGKIDLLHIHPSIRAVFYAPLVKVPVVFTLHDPIIPGKRFFYDRVLSKNIHYVSISRSQQKPAPELPWAGTVYNGIDIKKFPFKASSGKYLAIVGRMRAEKGIYEAIIAARKAHVPLKIAGNPTWGPYWERKIKPYLSRTIQHVGTIPYSKIPKFLSEARGFLFPIKWEEPFGLVMTESMATGTPVIAFNRGSVSEVMKNNKTGFIVKDVAAMVKAISRLNIIDRHACRKHVEDGFTLEKMVEGYEKIFSNLTHKI